MMGSILAAGGVLGALGSLFGGRASDIARKRMMEAANLAPLDIDEVVDKNLASQKKRLPAATELARLIDEYNAQQALAQLERMMPGYAGMRDSYFAGVQDDLAGRLSPDVEQAIFRAGAGRSLMSGQAGGARHRSLVARDIGATSDALRARGQAGFLQGVSTLPKISALDVLRAGFLGPTSQEALAIREKERAMRQQILAQAAGIKGQTGAFGSLLSGVGGLAAGAGMQSLFNRVSYE